MLKIVAVFSLLLCLITAPALAQSLPAETLDGVGALALAKAINTTNPQSGLEPRTFQVRRTSGSVAVTGGSKSLLSEPLQGDSALARVQEFQRTLGLMIVTPVTDIPAQHARALAAVLAFRQTSSARKLANLSSPLGAYVVISSREDGAIRVGLGEVLPPAPYGGHWACYSNEQYTVRPPFMTVVQRSNDC